MDANTGVVKDLQAALFPVCTKGSYLNSFLQNTLKSNQVEINTDSRTLKAFAKLKEPRDLFALPKELDCPQQAARWPSECQVLGDRVFHVDYVPPAPELYYQPTGREVQPKPVGEEAGQVVFQYYPMSAVNYFSRSSVGGSKYLTSACPNERNDEGLRFESRFESGNLAKVVQITDTYYELYLRTDLYTNRHMQWFYFRIDNTKKQTLYRLSIVNMSKAESLYNDGMKPLMYSKKDAQRKQVGWKRCGQNITYFRNDTNGEEDQVVTYTLSFNVEFQYDDDHVYIAHCYPYTYSDLQDYLVQLQNHPVKSTFSKLRLLCRSLAGNNVYYLTITAPSGDEVKKKKAIIITARVHPGETPSSWMMKGFMDFLTGDSYQAKELRDKFIFKLVPMLNPDGVIVGNNRCSLTGRDLNRQYRTVIRETYPPVWHTKLMIRRLIEECGVELYCDLHAHSRRHNIFIYGCESRRARLQEQVFPLMLHKNAADKFSFENCKFRIQRSKEGTGRVVIWMMGVSNSFTMEASFSGSTLGSRADSHFTTQDYEQMGRHFCETLLDFCDSDPSKNSTQQERLRHKIMNRLHKEGSNADEPTNINLSDYSSDEGDTSSDSSTSEEVERSGKVETFSSTLRVPPPSPVLPRREHHHSTVRQKTDFEKLSPPAREMLKVNRATLDIEMLTTDAGSDHNSESSCRYTNRKCRSYEVTSGLQNGESCDMPPELIVTPAQVYDSQSQLTTELLEKCSLREQSEEIVTTVLPTDPTHRPQSWHHLRCVPSPRSAHRKVSDLTNELQTKIGSSLRQKIWTGIPCACHSTDPDTYWSRPHGVAEEQNPSVKSIDIIHNEDVAKSPSRSAYSEQLLKSCSEKLERLQRVRKHEHKAIKSPKTKKKKSSLIKKPLLTSSSLDERKKLKSTKWSHLTASLDGQDKKYWQTKEFNLSLIGESAESRRVSRRWRWASCSDQEEEDIESKPENTKSVTKKTKTKDDSEKSEKKKSSEQSKSQSKEPNKSKVVKFKKLKESVMRSAVMVKTRVEEESNVHDQVDFGVRTMMDDPRIDIQVEVEEFSRTEVKVLEYSTDVHHRCEEKAKEPSEKKRRSLKWKFRKGGIVATAVSSKSTTQAEGRDAETNAEGKAIKKKRKASFRKVKPK